MVCVKVSQVVYISATRRYGGMVPCCTVRVSQLLDTRRFSVGHMEG